MLFSIISNYKRYGLYRKYKNHEKKFQVRKASATKVNDHKNDRDHEMLIWW